MSYDNDFGRSVIIFGVDNSSPSHADNRKNNFLILDEGTTYEINGSPEKKVCLSLHYNANGNVYNFSVDYNTIDKSDILSIHKYLMTKNNIK